MYKLKSKHLINRKSFTRSD